MVSAAEKIAANMHLGAFSKATELKKRIGFALGALIIYRIGTFIPIPGIDPVAIEQVFARQAAGLLGMLDMFAGGALGRMSIFALNIMPYITASIITQLMTAVSPRLEALKKEGEVGRKKINQYTRYGTVLLAIFQSYGVAVGLESLSSEAVVQSGILFRVVTVCTLVGGTIFLMWLGEQITARGIGNGISLLIFTGIVAEMPRDLISTLELGRTGALSGISVFLLLVSAAIVVSVIIYVERAQRRVPVHHPKRQAGMQQFGSGNSSHLPLKLNVAGVIPPIFASSLLLMPLTVASFSQNSDLGWITTITAYLAHGQPLYIALYLILIIFFAFFYTAIVFNPEETADNLRKYGGFIPGIRPGSHTADYLDYVLTRLTAVGAPYLAIVCLLPELWIIQMGVPLSFGGTSLLIVLTVTMDTVAQIHSYLIAHQYEGLIRKARLQRRK